MNNRRDFLKKMTAGAAGVAVTSSVMGMPAKNYRRIIGANDRLNVAIAGLGRRLGAYYEPIAMKEANVQLVYLCDVMEKQRERALQSFGRFIDYKPKLENDIRKVLADPEVDVLFKLPASEGKEYSLNPTHEEVVTPLMKEFIQSYKDLNNCSVYQFQTKFRNEARAKS